MCKTNFEHNRLKKRIAGKKNRREKKQNRLVPKIKKSWIYLFSCRDFTTLVLLKLNHYVYKTAFDESKFIPIITAEEIHQMILKISGHLCSVLS